jgi:hypothetical protein
METLIADGYLTQLPVNPFTNQPMKDIPYGSSDYYGNFTYLPVTLGDKVLGYYIIVYGYKNTEGQHLLAPASKDHVISMGKNSEESKWPADAPFPDVKQVIESTLH